MNSNYALTTLDSYGLYLKDVSKFPLLSAEEEFDLAKKFFENEDLSAAETLVTSNLRFVVKIANEYRRYGLKMQDLIQEGNVGLMHAVKKFDPFRGFKFISYAVWWIRAYMQSYIMKNWSLVKIGTKASQRKLFYKLAETKRNLLAAGHDLNEEQTQKEVSRVLDVPENDVKNMDQRMSQRDFSLNSKLNNDGHSTFLDMVEGSDCPLPGVVEKDTKAKVNQVINNMSSEFSEREKVILYERLMSDDEVTLKSIGDRYGISRERARQIELRLKQKIALKMEEAGLKL